jgi:hypothetical protein
MPIVFMTANEQITAKYKKKHGGHSKGHNLHNARVLPKNITKRSITKATRLPIINISETIEQIGPCRWTPRRTFQN